VRKHYKGKLALAQDSMVFNVTANDIVVRMAVTPTHVLRTKERHMAPLQPPGACKCPPGSRKSSCFPKFWPNRRLAGAEYFNTQTDACSRPFRAGAGD
jgi:ribonuclease Z